MSLHLEKQKVPCGMLSRAAKLIAIDENTGKLAVVRRSRVAEIHDYIEFYNILTGYLAVPELVICPENGSVEHMMFVENGELMTCHANGSVCFLDPHNSLRVKRVQVSASSIWAACKHPSLPATEKSIVALVSHSSVLYFFDVISKTIISSVSLGVDNRLFDVSSNGKTVAIGSIDGIILVRDGKVQQTLKLDRQNRRDPTIAWSVLFVEPTVLACGDSRGTVTLWNPDNGALIQAVSCLQSHILSMCLVENALNVSGVDPRIAVVKKSSDGVYDVVNRRSGPSRDVRSMAVYDNTIYAAGEDFDIFVCKNGCRKLLVQQQQNVLVARDVVASAGENYIDIWWKMQGEDEPASGSNILRQHYEMTYMAKIFTPKKRIITCWNLSECGGYLVVGTCHETIVYRLSPTAKKLSRKVVKKCVYDLVATAIFITKQNRVFAARSNFEVVEFELGSSQNKLKTVISQKDCGSVIRMNATPRGDYVSVLTTRSQIFSVNTETGDSRLLKVDLPIDVACTSTSAIVLTTQPAFSENGDAKKIFHEVTLSSGAVKRSASSLQLRMLPTSPKSMYPGQPIAVRSVGENSILAVSFDGHWSLIDVVSNSIISATDGPLKAKKSCLDNNSLMITGIRMKEEKTDESVGKKRKLSAGDDSILSKSSRILSLEVYGDEAPKISGFKIKKFGMQ